MIKPGTTSSSSSSEQQADRNEPKYKGVRKRKWGKWVSEIRLPNSRKRIWLGSYDTPEKAARAFDAALYCLRGGGAKFNFLDNPPDIVVGQSLSPQQIQEVAANFANGEPTSSTITRGESSSHVENFTSSSLEGGAGQMDCDDTIDWSFLNSLDSNEGASNFGLCQGQDQMDCNYYPLPSPSPSPSPSDHNIEDAHDRDETYSHRSFLWNF
ncbi:unnamed protein product [Dovyalis caffra]|uniref:AP2/ERF domain-containing protein n=1 Tax=Dovyalis caffra TaxID=77055 RepID=A0AAV1SMJ0_9ROSI|nr:unnamed protein product [Dovyalis caffra]